MAVAWCLTHCGIDEGRRVRICVMFLKSCFFFWVKPKLFKYALVDLLSSYFTFSINVQSCEPRHATVPPLLFHNLSLVYFLLDSLFYPPLVFSQPWIILWLRKTPQINTEKSKTCCSWSFLTRPCSAANLRLDSAKPAGSQHRAVCLEATALELLMNECARKRRYEGTDEKKAATQGCSDEGRGREHPLGACYTAPGSPGSEEKQLD